MRITYLILAHHQPVQLFRLIHALSAKDVFFYIHIDARSDMQQFEFIGDHFKNGVSFISEREICYWGQFSLVQATINLINAAGNNYDYYILLSAQDYPIKNNEQIADFLRANEGESFITHKALPCKEVNERQDGMYRINRRHSFIGKEHTVFPPYSKKKLFNAPFNAWAKWHSKNKRPMPHNMIPYWGEQWWILHKTSVAAVKAKLTDENIINFFKNTWIPDEMFFQTLLLNSGEEVTGKITNNNYKFSTWVNEGDFFPHPAIMLEEHFSALRNTDCLFARKFDVEKSKELITHINSELLHITTEM